jgi:hypothetical protein
MPGLRQRPQRLPAASAFRLVRLGPTHLRQADLAKADQAASHSTKFVLLAVLFALVLFFASVATKFSAPKVQVVLILVSLFLLAVALLRMLFLPVLLF